MTVTRRALLSVSDKSGLAPFAAGLAALGYEVISTGGTFQMLRDAGVPVHTVTSVTEHPEVFGGRVKTLHPKVHGGILFRRELTDHVEEAAVVGIEPIDIVVCNLYPFRETVARPGATEADIVEQIDIGGPAMLRAAAKNFAHVAVVTDPRDYDGILEELREGPLSHARKRALALQAFRHTASYDAAIARYLTGPELCPDTIIEPMIKVQDLRYGENPHQAAALYTSEGVSPLAGAEVLQGKALSYNNLVDLDGAVGTVLEFEDPAVVVVKHTNPCGVGRHPSELGEAWQRALAGDPVSAFGGIVAANRDIDGALAEEFRSRFLEVVAAPHFSEEALATLGRKKNLRVIRLPEELGGPRTTRQTLFGTLVQAADPTIGSLREPWNCVTDRQPTDAEMTALRFLWRVCKHVKSNAIVVGSDSRTFGVGAGQMSRVDAVELAIKKATGPLEGAALASDAFFPFRDAIDAAAAAGIRAVVQPGGSKRDPEVIEACNEHGITMVTTGHRHFRH